MHSTATMPGGDKTLNMSYFTKTTAGTDAEIFKERVIVPNDKCDAKGSIKYGIHYRLDKKSLDVKF